MTDMKELIERARDRLLTLHPETVATEKLIMDMIDALESAQRTIAGMEVEKQFNVVGWVCGDGTPALHGHKPLDPGSTLYARGQPAEEGK